MIVIAHRGASAELPENTLAAFERAIERGADMLELDVRFSRDGVLYVAHDPPQGKRRGDPRSRPPLPWPEIVARAVAPGAYPRLDRVLDAFGGRIPMNLELKERAAARPLVAELGR